MLTAKLLSCYNHLVATSMLYFTIVDPLRELTFSATNNHLALDNRYLPSLVEALQENPEQDYYKILGVGKDATKQEIHKAFRQLAKKYHPDKNKARGAQDEFIKIFKAYETLSDEKKRKEYDGSSDTLNHGSHGSWQTDGSNMNDFDVNEFFKQYEEQLFKHAQHFGQHDHHHQHHHHNQGHHDHLHHQFMFHGVNLDDLFHDIDEDEFHSFGRLFSDHHNNHIHSDYDGTFGDGASYFGTHFPSQIHNTLHQYTHQQGAHSSEKNSYSCHTITKQVNGIMMTQTSCG